MVQLSRVCATSEKFGRVYSSCGHVYSSLVPHTPIRGRLGRLVSPFSSSSRTPDPARARDRAVSAAFCRSSATRGTRVWQARLLLGPWLTSHDSFCFLLVKLLF